MVALGGCGAFGVIRAEFIRAAFTDRRPIIADALPNSWPSELAADEVAASPVAPTAIRASSARALAGFFRSLILLAKNEREDKTSDEVVGIRIEELLQKAADK